jgi:ABC-2 type transport system ATP-binding protein
VNPTKSSVQTCELEHVYRRFRVTTRALAGVSLEVAPGTIFGLLGRNGAGKTTLVKILLGLIYASGGRASVLGEPPTSHRMRRRIGYLPEQMRLPEHLKAESFLRYMGGINHVPSEKLRQRIPSLLEMVELDNARHKLLREYSKGMQQRIGIAQALLNDPDLLFLDEPTEGLDPLGRKQVRDLLTSLRAAGKTIFLNSHLLSEIELVCDSVAILEGGRVVQTGAPQELATATGEYRVRVTRCDDKVRAAAASSAAIWDDERSVRVRPRDVADLNRLIDALRAVPVDIEAVEPVRATLEESFIAAVAGKGN